MDARNLRTRTVRSSTRRPRQHRWGRGFRRGATLARRFFGAPVRVLRSPVRVLRFRRNAGSLAPDRHQVAPNPPDTAPVTSQSDSPTIAGVASVPAPTPVVAPLLTGERTARRRLCFVLVNLCTLASVALGMTAIFVAMRGELQIGGLLLLGCVFFDGLDGTLARSWGVSTPFGVQMDSLADMCSFGMATPVLAYLWLEGSNPSYVVAAVCALMGGCAALRLARFNISPKDGAFFSGVPTTVAAGIVVVFTLTLPDPMPLLPLAGLAVVALLMVSSFPYVKLQRFFGFPMWLWSIPVIVAYFDIAAAFALLVLTYLLSGPYVGMRNRRTRSRPLANA